MFDTIKFVLKESDLDNCMSFIEEIPCLISIKSSSANKVVGYLDNMKIEVRGTTLIVEGSLIKWLLGNNYAKCLSLWEVKVAINKLSKALNVSLEKAKVDRIDIAFNFQMRYTPWIYMKRLLYLDGYYRSNIKQETLYFNKYNCLILFYDKIAELLNSKSTGAKTGIEDLKEINVLRYELRFMSVTKIFGKTVRTEHLYNPNFCLLLLDKWYELYMKINKQFEEPMIRFNGAKSLKETCIAWCMHKMNLFDRLNEEFEKKQISSAEKFALKRQLERIEKKYLNLDNENPPMIDELTKKIENAYSSLKRRYNISNERQKLYRRLIDKHI